jgi:hypothetical protein
MARLIAFNAIFFLLPFAGYAAWLLATRGRANNAADWQVRRIAWLATGGAVLMIGALLVFIHFTGAPPGSKYVPAEIVDGVLVPGHFE